MCRGANNHNWLWSTIQIVGLLLRYTVCEQQFLEDDAYLFVVEYYPDVNCTMRKKGRSGMKESSDPLTKLDYAGGYFLFFPCRCSWKIALVQWYCESEGIKRVEAGNKASYQNSAGVLAGTEPGFLHQDWGLWYPRYDVITSPVVLLSLLSPLFHHIRISCYDLLFEALFQESGLTTHVIPAPPMRLTISMKNPQLLISVPGISCNPSFRPLSQKS